MNTSVYVIILTWNHVADTIECLDSVLQSTYPDMQIVVVDNASTDDTVRVIEEKYSSITILKNGKNLGYSEGNNVGIRYALEQKADFIFILNNDTVINPDTVNTLVGDLVNNPQAIAVSPKSYFYSFPEKVYFAGGEITEKGETRHDVGKDGDFQSYTTKWLNGCALMIHSEYLEQVGLFEPRFFLLYEDVDWSLRARRCGYDLRVVPNSTIKHKASLSFNGQKSPGQIYYYTRNRHLWYERNFPFCQRITFHAHAVCKNFKTFKQAIKILFAHTPVHKAIRQAYLDYCFRRFSQREYQW